MSIKSAKIGAKGATESANIAARSNIKVAKIGGAIAITVASITLIATLVTPQSKPKNVVEVLNSEEVQIATNGGTINNGLSQKQTEKILTYSQSYEKNVLDILNNIEDLQKQLEVMKKEPAYKQLSTSIQDAIKKGDYLKAQKIAQKNVTDLDKNRAPALYVLAFLQAKNMDMKGAHTTLVKTLNLAPNNIMYLTLMSKVSFYLRDINQSIKYTREILRLTLKANTQSPMNAFISRFNLASMLMMNKEFSEAIYQLDEALKLVQGNHIDEAYAFLLLSEIWAQNNDSDKSNQYLNNAMSTLTSIKGVNGDTLASLYKNIARNYSKKNQFDEAIKSLTLAVNLIEKELQNDPISAHRRHNLSAFSTELYRELGNVYFWNKNNAKAFSYLSKSLEQTILIYGDKVLQVAMDRDVLGKIYLANGNHKKSLHYFELALKSYELHLGETHISIAVIKSEIAKSTLSSGDKNSALNLYKESLNDFSNLKSKPEETLYEIAGLQQIIGGLSFGEKRYDDAVHYFNLSLATLKSIKKTNDSLYFLVEKNLNIASKALRTTS